MYGRRSLSDALLAQRLHLEDARENRNRLGACAITETSARTKSKSGAGLIAFQTGDYV